MAEGWGYILCTGIRTTGENVVEANAGVVTNGFVTIAGGASPPTAPYEVGGFTSYMLGVRSDLGLTDPTVVVECSGVQPHLVLTDALHNHLLVARSDGAAALLMDSSAAAFTQFLAGGLGLYLDADVTHVRSTAGTPVLTVGSGAIVGNGQGVLSLRDAVAAPNAGVASELLIWFDAANSVLKAMLPDGTIKTFTWV